MLERCGECILLSLLQWRCWSQLQICAALRIVRIWLACRQWICVDGERCRCCLGGCRFRRCCCCYGTQAAVAVPKLTFTVVLLSVTRWLPWRLPWLWFVIGGAVADNEHMQIWFAHGTCSSMLHLVEEDGGGCCVSPARMVGVRGSFALWNTMALIHLELRHKRNSMASVTTEAKRDAFWPRPNMFRFQTRNKMRKIIGTKSPYCTSVIVKPITPLSSPTHFPYISPPP